MHGKLKITITCADSALLLNALNAAGIWSTDVSYVDDLTIGITVRYNDYLPLQKLCNKQGASIKIMASSGLQFVLLAIAKRPVIIIFTCILMIASIYLPSRILFVSVEGNTSIATNVILEAVEKCGITLGASRRQVRSEKIKNALLQEIPELQWAGINTTGCTAIISVREKTTQDISNDHKSMVSSIVASRDGIIQSCTVYQGNSLCSVGQAVKKGQVLVSGYTDCGITTKATQAAAEIIALTIRDVQAVSPVESAIRGTQEKEIIQFSVRIGKKLIKLYKDSGNCDTTCAKIYTERYVRLPGGFYLPIAIVQETLCYYNTVPPQENSYTEEWLSRFAEDYLNSTMIAGNIVFKETQVNPAHNSTVLSGRYVCMEMIGKTRIEQMMIEGE